MRTTLLLCVVLGALSAQAQSQTQQATPPPPPPNTQPQYQPQPYPQQYPQQQYPQYQQPYQQPAPAAPYKPARIENWNPGDPIPEGYHADSRPRMGMVVGGALTFGIPYLISIIGGAIAIDTGSPNFWPLFVPVVGPFIQAGFVPSATEKLLFVFDGLAQVAGAAMFIVGLAVPHTYLTRDRMAWIAPTPIITRNGGAGVGLGGSF